MKDTSGLPPRGLWATRLTKCFSPRGWTTFVVLLSTALIIIFSVAMSYALGSDPAPSGVISPSSAGWEPLVSSMLGWAYFIAWSISFYPQVLQNWQYRSVEGLSFNYTALNVMGFLYVTFVRHWMLAKASRALGDVVLYECDGLLSYHPLTRSLLPSLTRSCCCCCCYCCWYCLGTTSVLNVHKVLLRVFTGVFHGSPRPRGVSGHSQRSFFFQPINLHAPAGFLRCIPRIR